MSSRSKRMITLALNKDLAEKITAIKNNKKRKRNVSDSSDTDYDEHKKKLTNNDKPKVKVISNICIKQKTSQKIEPDSYSSEVVNELLEDILAATIDTVLRRNEERSDQIEAHISNIEVTEDITFVQYLVEYLVDLAINESECKKQNFTKKGKLQKRQKMHLSVEERKKQTLLEKVKKHSVLEGCKLTCREKCNTKLNRDRMQAINEEFWKLSNDDQRQFIFRAVKNLAKKRNTTDTDSRRKNTLIYYLQDSSGLDCKVCKTFFLATLGYPPYCDRIVRDIVNKKTSQMLVAPPRKWSHPSEKKIDRKVIEDHINSFNPTISHYRREHAPLKKYLPSDVNITLMYRDFSQAYPNIKISYELYRQQVATMNISFASLGHEECWQCESHTVHLKSAGHSKDGASNDCQECNTWKDHNDRTISARAEYKNDVAVSGLDEKKLYFSADLQKVIMLPRCEMFKEIIFTPRIICFNESFVPLGPQTKTKIPIAILWHEGIAGRTQYDIMSTFYKFFIQKRDAKEITIWVDNCSAQNKNWALFGFFIYIINCNETSLELLKIKYLETGHTFMSADSFYHQVEKSLKQMGKVYDFNDYIECVKKSNNCRVHTIDMKIADFHDYHDFTSRYKLSKTTPKPYLSNFVEINFLRGHKTLFYKTSYNGDLIELNFLTAKAFKEGVPKPTPRDIPRGVEPARKLNLLQKLSGIVPNTRLQFWKDFPVSTEASTSLDD